MTTWDEIYKNYINGGEAYGTLSRDINPIFKQFISQTTFTIKYVLDIGCGDGRYLKLLQSLGFKTDGIDSSEMAVEMTKKLLGDKSDIRCVDMFDFDIPSNGYDLIISLFTIHHGTKEQVQSIVNRIQTALIPSGKIFITVPDKEGSKTWKMFKDYKEISPGTFMPLNGPERGLPHSVYTRGQVAELFSRFSNVNIIYNDTQWTVQADK